MSKKVFAVYVAVVALLLVLTACGDKETLPEHTVTIKLDYQDTAFGSDVPMNVYIDKTKLGRQEAGTVDTYTIALQEGEHEFWLKTDATYKTDKLTFEVTPDDISFSFGAKTRLTFGVEVWLDYKNR